MIINYENIDSKTFSPSEKAVINYINDHSKEIPMCSIKEIAERSFTSPATVTRAVHKCGFENIIELRGKIAQNTSGPYELTNEILEKSYTECTQTIENINIDDVIRTAEAIKKANKIYVLARGITSLVAEEFVLHMELQKINAILVNDSEVMRRMDILLENNNLVFVFTAHNSTPEFEIVAQMAKAVHSNVIVCCCRAHSALEKYAYIQFVGYSMPMVKGNKFNLSSRLPLQIIARTIIEYLVN